MESLIQKPTEENIRTACVTHGVLIVYEAFRRYMGEQDMESIPALGLANPPRWSREIDVVRALLPDDFKARESITFYKNTNTRETRHCFGPLGMCVLSFHDGFTPEDSEAGWKPVVGMQTRGLSDVDIADEHGRIAASFNQIA